MAYTAEEFDRCRNEAAFTTWNDGEEMIIRAALLIASAVIRPGVIEATIRELHPVMHSSDPPKLAEAIRAALTDAKP